MLMTPTVVKADNLDDIIKEIDELTSRSVGGSVGMSKDGKSVTIYKDASKKSEKIGIMEKKGSVIVDSNYDDKWSKVTANNGTMTGYVLTEKIITGDDVVKRCEELKMKKTAVVNTTELDVRKGKAITTDVIMTAKENESYEIIKEYDTVVKLQIDEDLTGYVTKDFVTNSYNFDDVRDLEAERIAAEKKAALEAAKRAAMADFTDNLGTSLIGEIKKNSLVPDSVYNLDAIKNTTELRRNIVYYALQFVGNKYVYGGTDINNGIDCSAYVRYIYKQFGYSLPRTSAEQRSSGKHVDEKDLLPGDLICYYGHVAMYLGDGKIVHASNSSKYPKGGIKVSNSYDYRAIADFRRIIE